MIDTRHVNQEDLALHAMRLLSTEEAGKVQAHLEECAECRAEFQAAQGDLEIAAMTVDLETPSPAARERFLRQISKEKRVVSIDRERPAPIALRPASGGKLLPWLGWAVAAGVAFSAGSLYREQKRLQTTVDDQSLQLKAETSQMASLSVEAAKARAIMDALTSSNAMHVSLSATPAGKALPQGRATYLPEKGMLVFMADNLAPLPTGKVYELWLIPADGTAAVAAGTFLPDGRGAANIVTSEIPKGTKAKAFGVTIEPEGGSTTPTLPIILVGT